MPFKKRETVKETIKETPIEIVSIPNIIRVMTKNTKEVIKIDANIETDYKTKYLHCSGEKFAN